MSWADYAINHTQHYSFVSLLLIFSVGRTEYTRKELHCVIWFSLHMFDITVVFESEEHVGYIHTKIFCCFDRITCLGNNAPLQASSNYLGVKFQNYYVCSIKGYSCIEDRFSVVANWDRGKINAGRIHFFVRKLFSEKPWSDRFNIHLLKHLVLIDIH